MTRSLATLLLIPALCLSASTAVALPASGDGIFTVQNSRIGSTVSLGGVVVPNKEVTLTAQLPGRIEFIAGAEGDRFTRETLLVSLDDDELLAQRQAAAAKMATADAALRNAGVQYNRELYSPRANNSPGGMGVPSLFDQMFTNQMSDFMGFRDTSSERAADLYGAGNRIEQARNALTATRSQLQALDAKLRYTQSTAPMDGVIIKKFVEVGDTVQPGKPLVKFANVDDLQIRVDVPARLMPGLQRGMKVPARLDVGDTRLFVWVAQIFPMADPERHTVTVKFELPKGSPGSPGMYAEVLIPDVSAPVNDLPVLPKAAIRRSGSLPGVYVLNERNEPELRLVRIGDQVNQDYVTVLSGVRSGDRVLMNPPGRSGQMKASETR